MTHVLRNQKSMCMIILIIITHTPRATRVSMQTTRSFCIQVGSQLTNATSYRVISLWERGSGGVGVGGTLCRFCSYKSSRSTFTSRSPGNLCVVMRTGSPMGRLPRPTALPALISNQCAIKNSGLIKRKTN